MSGSRVSLLVLGTLVAGLVMGNSLVSRAGEEPAPQLVNVAYIATGENFPDALVVGQATEPGPILLVTTNAVPQPTIDELVRLNPKKIVVVGGTTVISAAVETALGAYTSGAVIRIAGGDRYATAAALSADQYPLSASFTCPGIGFVPMNSTTSALGWDQTASQRTGDGQFACVAHLPDGATITRVQVAAYDDDSSGVVACGLWRMDVEGGTANSGQGTAQEMAYASTSLPGTPGYIELSDLSITNPIVDADRYGYWLICTIDGSDTRIVGMIINYRH